MKPILIILILLMGSCVAYIMSRYFFRKIAKERYSYRHVQYGIVISLFSWCAVLSLVIVFIMFKFDELIEGSKKPPKWLILVIPMILFSSCESKRAANKIAWLKDKNYLKDSSTTKFIKGKDSLITDTTYLQSVLRDSIHTDSIIYIRETKTLIREVLKHRVDTIVNDNSKTIYQKSTCNKRHWTILEIIGLGFICFVGGVIAALIFKR